MTIVNILNQTPQQKKVSTVKKLLDASQFDFYLTGSQYFRTAKPLSDWDFFTQDSAKIRDFLTEIGFVDMTEWYAKYRQTRPLTLDTHIEDLCYNSVEIVEVWRHKECAIDIQIVEDAAVKNCVQTIIYVLSLNLPPDNREAANVWNPMYRHIKALMDSKFYD